MTQIQMVMKFNLIERYEMPFDAEYDKKTLKQIRVKNKRPKYVIRF